MVVFFYCKYCDNSYISIAFMIVKKSTKLIYSFKGEYACGKLILGSSRNLSIVEGDHSNKITLKGGGGKGGRVG